MNFNRIELRTVIHAGIARDVRESYETPDVFPATRSGLALALDHRDLRRLHLPGCYGSIGAGGTNVYLIDNDGDELLISDDEDNAIEERDAWAEIQEPGDPIGRDVLQHMVGEYWDGNNHVPFYPNRCEEFCHEPDVVEHEFGSVTYRYEGNGDDDGWRVIEDIAVRDGWVTLGEDGAGEYDAHGDAKLTEDEFDAAWETDLRDLDVFPFEDTGWELRALYCPAKNLEQVRERVRAAMATDDAD